jgi:erythromycin esterase
MQYTAPSTIEASAAATAAWKTVIDEMNAARDSYAARGVASQDVEWAIQNARVAMQSMQMQANQVSRDFSMAQNVDWILKLSPDAKVVLWAHNGHVERQPGSMGSFLDKWYGQNYLPIDFAFHEGRYNAVGSSGLNAYDASASFPGSAEYIFHQTGIPQFILDLRKPSLDQPASAWMLGDVYIRNIGAVVADGFAPRHDLSQYSDGLIFFDHSSPSTLLP